MRINPEKDAWNQFLPLPPLWYIHSCILKRRSAAVAVYLPCISLVPRILCLQNRHPERRHTSSTWKNRFWFHNHHFVPRTIFILNLSTLFTVQNGSFVLLWYCINIFHKPLQDSCFCNNLSRIGCQLQKATDSTNPLFAQKYYSVTSVSNFYIPSFCSWFD